MIRVCWEGSSIRESNIDDEVYKLYTLPVNAKFSGVVFFFLRYLVLEVEITGVITSLNENDQKIILLLRGG
ncbi:MAG: hypothetical protein N2712_04555 [Brevinematales bacterium]|nr:hypothetical protein [Brevinematales bacterium]